jgi:hypothetical protein
MTKQQLTEHTIAVWQPRTPRHLSTEDAREITENLTGFFSILTEWSYQESQVHITDTVDCADVTASGVCEK